MGDIHAYHYGYSRSNVQHPIKKKQTPNHTHSWKGSTRCEAVGLTSLSADVGEQASYPSDHSLPGAKYMFFRVNTSG